MCQGRQSHKLLSPVPFYHLFKARRQSVQLQLSLPENRRKPLRYFYKLLLDERQWNETITCSTQSAGIRSAFSYLSLRVATPHTGVIRICVWTCLDDGVCVRACVRACVCVFVSI